MIFNTFQRKLKSEQLKQWELHIMQVFQISNQFLILCCVYYVYCWFINVWLFKISTSREGWDTSNRFYFPPILWFIFSFIAGLYPSVRSLVNLAMNKSWKHNFSRLTHGFYTWNTITIRTVLSFEMA